VLCWGGGVSALGAPLLGTAGGPSENSQNSVRPVVTPKHLSRGQVRTELLSRGAVRFTIGRATVPTVICAVQ
jgi:hypothetical protein